MKQFKIVLLSALVLSLASCSGGKTSSGSADGNGADYASFMGQNALASAATIDSLALEADFLTPQQGVSVLVGLSEIARNEQGPSGSGKRLEYMRKYLDTYDILMDRGDEFKEAIAGATASAHVNLSEIADKYRDILNEEADGSSIEDEADGGTTSVAPVAKTDSASTAAAVPAEDAPKATPAEPTAKEASEEN
ncbi:MAG: hypothetical protein NC338_03160 [Firmicutes bacterium]|nr:hypothetical protein [Bacillota bacterium]MCM1400861.1 hypothetical protein [Bacteroides sp.]MCM1476637.1 hypothetical protein [Bacteroides sp.]